MKTNELQSPNQIVNDYNRMLRKFKRLGIGKQTENGVRVTQTLIDTILKRRNQLIIRKIDL